MLDAEQLERYAEVLIWGLKTARTGKYKPGDVVLIRYSKAACELAEVVYRKVLEAGLNPVQRMILTHTMEKDFFEKAAAKQLVFQAPGDKELFEHLSGNIFIDGPDSITHLSGVDPKRIGAAAKARKPYRDILDKREEQGLFGWTLCMWPTEELAKHAGMSLDEYTRQIVKACHLDKADPVAEWQSIHKNSGAIKKWLNNLDATELRIESANTDLIVTPGAQRRWLGVSGHNIPSFEIFLSPDWRGTKGRYYADQPSYRSGNLVEGVRLEFEKGKAVKIEATRGADFVRGQLAMDAGACRLGEFSLTDKRFSSIDRFMANTLFDENFGGEHGNCHVAVGASYSDTFAGDPASLTPALKKKLGFNDSALHWDLVNTENKRVTAKLKGGRSLVIYENGQFVY